MAKHTDAVATTGAKASVETVVQDRVQGDVADTISDLREQVGLLKRQIAAEQNSHKQEVARLNEIVQQLQGRRSAPVVEAEPHTPQGAVSYVISFFEGVATGGAASDLRKAVHHAALRLNGEQRKELREFTSRLKYAAEAVDQEAIGLAV